MRRRTSTPPPFSSYSSTWMPTPRSWRLRGYVRLGLVVILVVVLAVDLVALGVLVGALGDLAAPGLGRRVGTPETPTDDSLPFSSRVRTAVSTAGLTGTPPDSVLHEDATATTAANLATLSWFASLLLLLSLTVPHLPPCLAKLKAVTTMTLTATCPC